MEFTFPAFIFISFARGGYFLLSSEGGPGFQICSSLYGIRLVCICGAGVIVLPRKNLFEILGLNQEKVEKTALLWISKHHR